MSLSLALLGYFILAVVAILDKFIVSKERVRPALLTFYSSAPVILIMLAVPFGVRFFDSATAWLAAVVSGVAFMLAMWAMFKGYERSEITHLSPFIGGVIPLGVLVFAQIFIAETVAPRQLMAIALLIIGSFIISFEQTKQFRGWNGGMIWGLLAGLLFALSHVTAKYLYDAYDFWSGFVWSRAALGASGVLLLFLPAVHKNLRRPSVQPGTRRARYAGAHIVSDKILGIVGAILLQYATALGSVTVVNALAGIQFVFLIIFVYVLSLFWPRVFKEDYRRGELVQEGVAAVVLMAGLGILIL